jgi:superoxide reductase
MDRRDFLYYLPAATATATLTTMSSSASAVEVSDLPPKNVIFSQQNAGVWDAKKASHVPKVELVNGKVVVSTDHGQTENHYIVRHTLVLGDGEFVGAKTFSHEDDPVSEYKLPAGYNGKLYATSYCNKHDLWVSELKV